MSKNKNHRLVWIEETLRADASGEAPVRCDWIALGVEYATSDDGRAERFIWVACSNCGLDGTVTYREGYAPRECSCRAHQRRMELAAGDHVAGGTRPCVPRAIEFDESTTGVCETRPVLRATPPPAPPPTVTLRDGRTLRLAL
jgi:hypothetical protein